MAKHSKTLRRGRGRSRSRSRSTRRQIGGLAILKEGPVTVPQWSQSQS